MVFNESCICPICQCLEKERPGPFTELWLGARPAEFRIDTPFKNRTVTIHIGDEDGTGALTVLGKYLVSHGILSPGAH